MRGADCNTRQFVVESVEQRFGYLGRLGGSDNVDREAFDRKYTRRLNLQQTEAVHAVDGAVLLLAVPGSGKTTVLVTRLGYMLCCCGIAPDQILTMTYTRAATREMKQRFSRLFGDDCPQIPQFRTINGVSSKIISFYTQDHGKGQAFPLIEDEGALARLVSDLYRELSGEYATQSVTKGLRRCIAYAKNMMLNQEEISQLDTGFEKFPELYSRYNQTLRRQRWMDYDDQMVYAKTILERYPDVLAHFQEAFPYICVDESQDTSRIQHAIINLLARKSGNIFLVGDEDQSIYGFRAAYPDALMQFERTYPGARVLLMEENYRSTPEILRTADAFIRRNHDRRPKTIRPTRASGAGVHLVRAADRAAQYAWLIHAAAHSDGQMAVLYRNNDSVLPLIDLLDRRGIPYRCRQTDDTFFTHRLVTDILDIIAFAHDGQNAEVFLRIYYKLGGGISKKEAEFACEKSAASGKPILQELLRFPQLPTFVRDSVTGLISLLPRLLTDPAQRGLDCIWQELRYRDYVERQQLDGILPAADPKEPEDQRLYQEERRIFYVAMTRAKDHLFLFSCLDRESSFIRELQKDLPVETSEADDVFGSVEIDPCGKPYHHARKGRGTVLACCQGRCLVEYSGGEMQLLTVGEMYDQRRLLQRLPEKPAVRKEGASAAGAIAGRSVVHTVFGPGRITAYKDPVVTIRFPKVGEKHFILSESIKRGLLRYEDGVTG